ncbi:MAG: winged helix-turn-helix domain-containing protein [Methylocella sp.]
MQRWIRDRMPDQMQLPFALWTAQAVRELIHKKFGKTLGLSTMPLYLKRWGFTAQKPLTRAVPRDPQKIAAWFRSDYPRIAARAKREKAAIHWSGETSVRDQNQIGWRYAPEDRTPVLTQARQKFPASMIAAASNRGLMRFKLHEGALNGAIFIDFMTRLVRDAKQKVFLIVGDPRVHLASFDKGSGAVQEWLAHHTDEIGIFPLPADAPEHTPDQYPDNDLKQTIESKPPARSRDGPVATNLVDTRIDPEAPGSGQVMLSRKTPAQRRLNGHV